MAPLRSRAEKIVKAAGPGPTRIDLRIENPDAAYHLDEIDSRIAAISQPELHRHHHGLRVLIDLDSTIYPLFEAFRTLPEGRRCRIENCPSWATMPDLVDGNFLQILDRATSYETMSRVGLYPGARSAINQLRGHGVAVEIVTHRWAKTSDDIELFLSEEGVEYDNLVVDMKVDKLKHCRENEISLAIDDKPDFIESCRAGGVVPASMAWPYNRSAIGAGAALNAENWLDLTKAVLGELGSIAGPIRAGAATSLPSSSLPSSLT